MSEDMSRLMDGELDDDGVDRCLAELRRRDAIGNWACYHVIGDQLRGTTLNTTGFSARFARRLASEPTVLAPRKRAAHPVVAWAWAAAAGIAAVTVVGWTALTLTESPPAAVAKAGEGASVARVRAPTVPQDYVLVHQEYSPATALQGVQPYVRAVAAPGGDTRAQ